MSQNLPRVLQSNLRLDLNFSKKQMHYEQPSLKSRTHKTFALNDISNFPSYGILTQSTCLDSTRRDSLTDPNSDTQRESTIKQIETSQINHRKNYAGVAEQEQQRISVLPGIKFGRFFGSVQDATKRTVARRISVRQGRTVEPQKDEMEILKQTLTILNDNEQPSHTEKYLLRKIQNLNMELAKLSKEHPVLQQQNKELKEQNRVLRSTSTTSETKLDWWEKYATQKDMEVIRKINSNYLTQMKMLNLANCPSRASSKSMILPSLRQL